MTAMKVKELRELLKSTRITDADFYVVEIASAEMRKTCVVITPGDETKV